METILLYILAIVYYTFVLEVTMRDGNDNYKYYELLTLTISFRSDYEGWKLKHVMQTCT